MQPYLYRKEDLSNEEKSIINLYDKVRPVHGGDEIGNYLRNNNIYEDILMVMHDNKKTYGSVTDLCDLFRKEKKFRHYTLVHFNDDGYNDIANAISAVMIDRSLST